MSKMKSVLWIIFLGNIWGCAIDFEDLVPEAGIYVMDK